MDHRDRSGEDLDGTGTRARLTPYELVFAADDFEARVFPRIHAEAESHGVDTRLRERFGLLSTAGEAVRDVIPPDAPPEAFEQYRALLFHAFNFWCYGKRVYLTETPVARYLVEAAPRLQGWELALPHPCVYLQLPARLFWGSVSPDSPPEPVDGLFVTSAELADAFGEPFQRLEILLVLGMRRDRAGFSVIPFDTESGPGIAAEWAETSGRDQGSDFENVLPGGEIAGLYSILTTAEVLKLMGRVLWYVDSFPESVALESAPERRAEAREDSPPLPRLPYHRVSLGDRPAGAEP